jgi:hypothetical protein
MSNELTIELPQYENESPQAYEARVLYVTLGINRTIKQVAERLGKHHSQLARWSTVHGWLECARQYDETILNLEVQQRSAEYKKQIELHRIESATVGDELLVLGRAMASEIMSRMSKMRYKPSDLQTAVKAILYGMDLKAHALELDRVLDNSTSGDYFE